MVYSLEEFAVVAFIIIIVLILSFFFGIFWAILLVFTFLWLLYQFGRPTRRKTFKTCSDTDSKPVYMDDTVYTDKQMDVPFTGLPSPRGQSIRSPMPLLSNVTKRLSFNFNTSSFSPRDNHRTSFRRSFGSPLSPIIQQQSPRHFSLINPKLQYEPTIKIAPPPTDKRMLQVQEEANGSIQNPLSRSAILSALKQSTARKRTAYETEEVDSAVLQSENHKKKRRYNCPNEVSGTNSSINKTTAALDITQDLFVDPPNVERMPGINKLIQARLKRRPLHSTANNDDNDGIKQSLSKKTRSTTDMDRRLPQLKESKDVNVEKQDKADSTPTYSSNTPVHVHSTATNRSATKPTFDKTDSDSGCDADDDDDIIMKTAPTHSERSSKRHTDVGETNRTKRTREESSNYTPTKRVSKQQLLSRKQLEPSTPRSSDVTSSPSKHSSSDATDSPGQKSTPKKRFSIIRFPSKNSEAKRRPVPVYCASVNSPDLPKRQPITHKITKEDIELDRKLAWQRIQSFLDASDEEDDKEATSPTVALNVVTCLASPSKSVTSTPTISGGLASIGQSSIATLPSLTNTTSITTTAITTSKLHVATPTSSTVQSQPLQSLSTPSSLTMFLKTTSTKADSSTGLNSSTSTIQAPIAATATAINLAAGLVNTTTTSGTVQGTSGTVLGTSSTSIKPTFLTSVTSSSQSIQTPICTPAIQIPFSLKTSTTPAITASPVSISLPFGSGTSTPYQGQTINPLVGGSIVRNPPLPGSNITNLLLGGSNNTNQPQGGFTIPKPITTSLFSGLSGSPINSVQKVPATASGGLDFNASAITTGAPSTFTFGSHTSAPTKPLGFGTQQPNTPAFGAATSTSLSMFGSSTAPAGGLAAPTSSVGGSSLSMFGASSSTQNAFTFTGSTPSNSTFTQKANPAAVTKLQPNPHGKPSFTFGAATQGTPTTQGVFGASTAKPMFGSASTQSPFGTATIQNAFGSPAVSSNTQIAFGAPTASNITQNAFGAQVVPSTTQSAFGIPTASTITQNAFGAQVVPSTSQNVFGSSSIPATAQNGFTFAAGTSTPAFGSQATQSTFGKPTASGMFGSSTTQNAFGAQSGSQNNAAGFTFGTGTKTTTNSSGGFNFGAGSSTTAGTANSGGFGFGPGSTNSTTTKGFPFGTGGTNAATGSTSSTGGFSFAAGNNVTNTGANPSGGFAFGSGNTNPTTSGTPSSGGFNFGSGGATNPVGFNFGGSSSAGNLQFGATGGSQQNVAPTFGNAPTAAPGGFNFGGGSATPAFGGSTNQGSFAFGSGSQTPSSTVAKARPKGQTRRRARK